MKGKRVLLVLLMAGSMLLLPLQASAEPLGQPETPGVVQGDYVYPVFDPYGPHSGPGVWVWSLSANQWLWIEAYNGDDILGIAAVDSQPPAWPANPALLQVRATGNEDEYWVWDVFSFAISADAGPSFWIPRWRLVSGLDILGQ
jgi:hypothetical protein